MWYSRKKYSVALLVIAIVLACVCTFIPPAEAGSTWYRGETLAVGELVKLDGSGLLVKTTGTSDIPMGVVTNINIFGAAALVNIVNTDNVYVLIDEAITIGEFISPSSGTAGTVVGGAVMQDNSFAIAKTDSSGGQVEVRFVVLNNGAGGGAPNTLSFWTLTAEAELSNETVVNNEASLESALSDVSDVFTDNDSEYAVGDKPIVDIGYLDFDLANGIPPAEGRMVWNPEEGTLDLGMPGDEVNLQMGQELIFRARNDEGATISNGELVRILAGVVDRPTIEYANASEVSSGVTGFATEDIGDGQLGYVTTQGLVRGNTGQPIDTSSYAPGTFLFADDTDGQWTTVPPADADRKIFVGTVVRQHASEGVILADIINSQFLDGLSGVQVAGLADNEVLRYDSGSGTWSNALVVDDTHPPTLTEAFSGSHTFDYLEYFNGTIIETVNVDITEAGGTVSLELQAEPTGDLTLNFSDGHHAFDATGPVASVALTNGTDTVPVKNWVYIPQSSDTLTASTVGWPDAEHAPIATVVVQSAATAGSVGPHSVHVWTDHIKDSNDQGHQTDFAGWARDRHAAWKEGVTPTLTFDTGPEPDTAKITTTSGKVRQLHGHNFPAFTGTPTIYVYNEPGAAYNPITGLEQLTQDSAGNAFTNNDYFTVVLWGIVSEVAADCKLYLNLPSGVYGNTTAALLDSSRFTDTSVPSIYKGSAFLISWYTMRFQTIGSGTFTLVAGGEIDLRGQPPGTSTGGGAGGGSSLTIEEQDASPSIPDVNTIKFSNGSVTDDGGGIVSVTFVAGAENFTIGASFPGAPTAGELFYHTTHDMMFQFENSVWNPHVNYGATLALYVDAGSGSDAVGKGFGSGADATATIQYCWDMCVPATFNGTITINIAAGTYTEQIILAGKTKGSSTALVQLLGALSNQASGTASAGGNQTLTDTGETWATNEFQYDLLRLTGGTGSGQHAWIASNTDAEVATIAGRWLTNPAGDTTYSIDQLTTIVNGGAGNTAITLDNQQGVELKYLKSNAGATFVLAINGSVVTWTALKADTTSITSIAFWIKSSGITDTSEAIFANDVNSYGFIVAENSAIPYGALTRSYFLSCGAEGLLIAKSVVWLRSWEFDGNTTRGVHITEMSVARFTTAFISNETTGVDTVENSFGKNVTTGITFNGCTIDYIGARATSTWCAPLGVAITVAATAAQGFKVSFPEIVSIVGIQSFESATLTANSVLTIDVGGANLAQTHTVTATGLGTRLRTAVTDTNGKMITAGTVISIENDGTASGGEAVIYLEIEIPSNT